MLIIGSSSRCSSSDHHHHPMINALAPEWQSVQSTETSIGPGPGWWNGTGERCSLIDEKFELDVFLQRNVEVVLARHGDEVTVLVPVLEDERVLVELGKDSLLQIGKRDIRRDHNDPCVMPMTFDFDSPPCTSSSNGPSSTSTSRLGGRRRRCSGDRRRGLPCTSSSKPTTRASA